MKFKVNKYSEIEIPDYSNVLAGPSNMPEITDIEWIVYGFLCSHNSASPDDIINDTGLDEYSVYRAISELLAVKFIEVR